MKVIAIFDIGKTNKKIVLFNEEYQVVFQKSLQLPETKDEDGELCEDINALRLFIIDSLAEVMRIPEFNIAAINFSTYGASFVYVNEMGEPLTALYNYLKKYPAELQQQFYAGYGGEELFSTVTASPVLGSLNSGLQVYRLKKEQPGKYAQTLFALHLPQYLSSLITKKYACELTSIGCHTGLWNFEKEHYHYWVTEEKIIDKLPPILPANSSFTATWIDRSLICGIGLHDSSAALIPYLANFSEPFVLISTGTWCISLNPFNKVPLSIGELKKDCLCYLTYHGNPVKASRLFAGNEHEEQVKQLAAYYKKPLTYFKEIEFNLGIAHSIIADNESSLSFNETSLSAFENFEMAYHHFMYYLVKKQVISTQLIMNDTIVKRIFVDGGFSKNTLFMNLLAMALPGIEIYAASMAQASALGAALAIHNDWNSKTVQKNSIELRYYSAK